MNKSEQIELMQKEIDRLVKELSDAKAKEDNANSAKETWYKAHNDVSKELVQLHTLLDVLPGSIPKRDDDSYTDRSALLRLSAWLSIRK